MGDMDEPTVFDRMLAAGISPERASWHLETGAVLLDGERVTDPSTPAAPPSRVVLKPA